MALGDYRVGVGASADQWREWAEGREPVSAVLYPSRPVVEPAPSSALERALGHLNLRVGDVSINRARPLADALLALPLADRAAIARELLGAGGSV